MASFSVNIRAPLEDYREVRFFRRGHHKETVEISEWLGFRKRRVEFGVYDDVVLLVTMKGASAETGEACARNRKVRPGAVLLKYFRDIASADLNALFPDVRVVMGLTRPAHARRASADRRHPDPAQACLDADGAVPGGRVLSRLGERGAGRRNGGRTCGDQRPHRARRIYRQPVGAVPAPVAAASENPVRQRLLPQRQQQRRHLRLHHRRSRGAGVQGSVPGLLLPAQGWRTDGRRARSAHRGLAQQDIRRRRRFRMRRCAGEARTARPVEARRRANSQCRRSTRRCIRLDRIWDNFFLFDSERKATSG